MRKVLTCSRLLHMLLLSTMLLGVSYPACASSQNLEIRNVGSNESWEWWLYLSGSIGNDDYQRVSNIIREHSSWPRMIHINDIRGGNVVEALKLAKLFDKMLAPIHMGGTCASACIYLVIGANERHIMEIFGPSRVLLHRPFFSAEWFSELNLDDASDAYQEMESKLRSFLESRNVPGSLQDRMFQVPSNRAVEMSGSEFITSVGVYHRSFEEYILANCGDLALSEEEERDYNELVNEWLEHEGDERSDFMKSLEGRYFTNLKDKKKGFDSCKDSSIMKQRMLNYLEWVRSEDN